MPKGGGGQLVPPLKEGGGQSPTPSGYAPAVISTTSLPICISLWLLRYYVPPAFSMAERPDNSENFCAQLKGKLALE